MLDSQPNASVASSASSASSASRPRNSRVSPPRRPPAPRRSADSRQESSTNARWKVQLELDPAEIALVYRQGLARGAEVCRRGTQEWRPLVTTPELRPALSARSTLRSLKDALCEAPAPMLTLTQTLQISDPSLAALVLRRRPSVAPSFVAPPPPVVVARSHTPEPSPFAASAVPELTPRALPPPLPPLVPPPGRAKSVRMSWLTQHARPAELTLVAAIAVVLTLAASLLAERASSSRSASASLGELSAPLSAQAAGDGRAASRALDFGPSVNIPVIAVHDLPVEALAAASPVGPPALTPIAQASSAGFVAASASRSRPVDASALGRVMTLAGRVAQGCGPGPVNTQVVATFAPSGVLRAVHFAAGAPPVRLRSCVLRAIARARVKPFQGAAVTVSKTLRW